MLFRSDNNVDAVQEDVLAFIAYHDSWYGGTLFDTLKDWYEYNWPFRFFPQSKEDRVKEALQRLIKRGLVKKDYGSGFDIYYATRLGLYHADHREFVGAVDVCVGCV